MVKLFKNSFFVSGDFSRSTRLRSCCGINSDNDLRSLTFRKSCRHLNYDDVNRLIKKIIPAPTGGVNWETDFTYDLLDNLDMVTDPDSFIDLDYDDAGRLTAAKTATSLLQPDVTLEYTYDKNGNRDTLKRQFGAGTLDLFIDYTFDNLNRIDTIQNALASLTVDINHDVLSRREKVIYPNNTTVDYAYDLASQLTDINHKLSGLSFSDFNYNLYDNVGNRKQVTITRTGVTVNSPLDYVYDNLYRLQDASDVVSAANPNENFTYDDVGNRLRKVGQAVDSTFDAANRLLDDTVFTYTYDFNGNLKTKTETSTSNLTTYTYDAENQLIKITFPDLTFVEYAYDGLGRRIQKSLNALPTTRYVYDNEDILFEFDALSSTPSARYTHGVGIDEPLIMERDEDASTVFEADEAYFYHTDGLGSIVEITDNLGAIVNSYVYDSFGNIVLQIGSLTNPYTYTGREFDSESGLYYFRARYYDASSGRFIQEDPVGFLGGVNFYVYGINNPIMFIDPSGLDVWIEGPSGDEPFAHQSINVGNPNGQFYSYSFGWNGQLGLQYGMIGEVYLDTKKGGKIEEEYYLLTTKEEDQIVLDFLDSLVGTNASYVIVGSNCRTFSQNAFDLMFNQGIGEKASPAIDISNPTKENF